MPGKKWGVGTAVVRKSHSWNLLFTHHSCPIFSSAAGGRQQLRRHQCDGWCCAHQPYKCPCQVLDPEDWAAHQCRFQFPTEKKKITPRFESTDGVHIPKPHFLPGKKLSGGFLTSVKYTFSQDNLVIPQRWKTEDFGIPFLACISSGWCRGSQALSSVRRLLSPCVLKETAFKCNAVKPHMISICPAAWIFCNWFTMEKKLINTLSWQEQFLR